MEFIKVKIKSIAVSNQKKFHEISKTLNDIFLRDECDDKTEIQNYRYLSGIQENIANEMDSDKKLSKRVICYTPIIYEKSLDLEKLEIELESKYIYDIPDKCTEEDSVCLILTATTVYTDIYFKGRCLEKEKVLVLNGASDYGYIALQLLYNLGCEIYASVNSKEEFEFLTTHLSYMEIKVLKSDEEDIATAIKKVHLGIGMDCIIDYDISDNKIKKRNIIEMLAPNGRWVTHDLNLQIDPPESLLLFMKSCTLSYSFEDAYEIYGLEYGKIRLVISESLELLSEGKIKVVIKNRFKSVNDYEKNNSINIGSSIIDLK